MTHDALSLLVGEYRAFAEEHWGQSPLLRRGAWPGASADLVNLPEILKTLTSSALRPPHVRLVKNGRPVSPERFTHEVRIAHGTITNAVDSDRLLSEFRDGATIMLDAFEAHSRSVQEACTQLSQALRCPVDSYVFITPPGEKGLELHYDIKDVFAVQLVGAKHWKVYPQIVPAPDDSKVLPDTDLGKPEIDTVLMPDDMIYMPKGTPHIAAAPEVLSIHISFAAKPATWAALVQELVAQALEAPAFATVPNLLATKPDVLRTQLSINLDELDRTVRTSTGTAVEGLIPPRPALVNALQSLTALATPDADPCIRRERPISVNRNQSGKILVRTGGVTFAVPEAAFRPIEELSRRETMPLAEFTQHLERANGIALLGHLVGYGAVSIFGGGS